jgi:hypothetical protein
MSQLAARFIRGRRQVTLGGLLIVIAIATLLVNRFRPLTAMEAARIAEAHFLKMRGASRFEGRYRVQPRDFGDWSVLILESDTDERLAVVWVDRAGKVRAVGRGAKLSLRRGDGKSELLLRVDTAGSDAAAQRKR